NVRIVDPARNIDGIGHVLMAQGVIASCELGPLPDNLPQQCEIMNGRGKIALPGLIDSHVRVGEPGAAHRETFDSLGQAAVAGGVTSVLMLPDTDPVIDSPAMVDYVTARARHLSAAHIYPAASLTKGLAGREMSEIGLLREAGCRALYHGPYSMTDPVVLKRTLTYARDFGAPVICETQDEALGAGAMNAGLNATRLGVSGSPVEAEIIPLERDMRLVAMTSAQYHAAQISTAESVDIIRRAKAKGLPVTAGASINHLTLNETDIGDYRTFMRLLPPLRTEDDRIAMVEALADGTIDVLHSAHDPQDVDVKRHPFSQAGHGAIGIETLLAAALRMHQNESAPLHRIIAALTANPAAAFGLNAGSLAPGSPADCTLVDLDAPFVVDPEELKSLSKNTAFEKSRFEGRVEQTFVGGLLVHTHASAS
ncbi:MAG: amidohydrolase family protein, partial [Pseudomonadota bacterium]